MSNRAPLVVYLDKKYLLAFRITMLLVSLPFLHDVYLILASGIADSGKYIVSRGEGWGYYAYLFKKISVCFLIYLVRYSGGKG